MLELELKDRVEKFLTTLQVVHPNQIYRFFRDEHKIAVSRAVTNLYNEFRIFKHGEFLATAKTLPTAITNYADRIKAIYVLCLLESQTIKWFVLDEYPWEILFVTNEGVCFAVTVFNSMNWSTKYAMIKKLRSRPLVKDIPDPVNYIAVIPNEDIIPKIRDLGFAYYATVDNNGHTKMMHDESPAAT